MKIEFANRTWEVEPNDLSLTQAVVITGRIGGSLADWDAALEDPKSPGWLAAVQCLYWLMRQQDGDRVAIGDVDFAVLRFSQAVADAVTREGNAATEAEMDPMRPGGRPGEAESPADGHGLTGSPASPI